MLIAVQKLGPGDVRKGLYKAKIIQAAINRVWFHNKKDEGIKYPEFYRPVPEVGLALVLTAVRNSFDLLIGFYSPSGLD